ncbi:MAG: hypothetical protein QUS12_04655 [Methanosarcina sp.]|uniref:hypothetical protein n=1 Tax=Methanosarcina sp. TaxID=2213 RepID=UPI002CD3FD2F|nr:hypothetical protein [Methanosarcina sp.]MDM7918439.1 hypothetical protein [Methanosarcina sp.]HOW13884.1 hypothetical protein [Methanosarcina sp.]
MIDDSHSKLAGKRNLFISKIAINLKRGYEKAESRIRIDENQKRLNQEIADLAILPFFRY